MNDEIKGLVAELDDDANELDVQAQHLVVTREFVARIRQAASLLTLSDEARVRAERRVAVLEASEEPPTTGLAAKLVDIACECANGRPVNGGDLELIEEAAYRLQASEALVRELVEGLSPLVEAARSLSFGEDWNNGVQAKTHGYREKLLAALPKAHALILRAEGEGPSVADIAAPVAPQPGCSAAQSLDGGEG